MEVRFHRRRRGLGDSQPNSHANTIAMSVINIDVTAISITN
jgi:hypothetical protein